MPTGKSNYCQAIFQKAVQKAKESYELGTLDWCEKEYPKLSQREKKAFESLNTAWAKLNQKKKLLKKDRELFKKLAIRWYKSVAECVRVYQEAH